MTIKQIIQDQALSLCKQEWTEWEVSPVYITDKVRFNMKEVIRQCRKNYWGIFDNPTDPATGRDKVWEHLTKVFVDFVVKNHDVDLKDLTFRAKHPSAIGLTAIIRSVILNALDEIFFGEDLDITLRQKAIDGTVVWANENELKPRLVNLLNFGIDPTAFSIADSYSIQERMLPSVGDFKKMARSRGFINWKDIQGQGNLNPNDPRANNSQITEKRVDLHKRVGMAPLFFITGKPTDMDEEVPTEIWYSVSGGNALVHEIKRRKDNKDKGYEEAWHIRVFGRWYGEGVGERLIWKQIQENENINIRRTRALVSQLGIFLIRQGAGITPQMIQRLSANGALPVTNIDSDVKQLPIVEASQSSYTDSDLNYQWSQKLSGAFEASIGESLPSTTTATVGVIQKNSADTGFQLLREQFGMFLERWVKHQAWPIISKTLKVGDVIRLVVDPDTLSQIDEQEINKKAYAQLEAINKSKRFVDPTQVQFEIMRAKDQLKAMGGTQFVKLLETPDVFKYDIAVQTTNEKMDISVKVQNLLQMLQLTPQYQQQIADEIFDLLGIGPFKPKPVPQIPGKTPPNGQQQVNPQEIMTQANTQEAMGVPATGGAVG